MLRVSRYVSAQELFSNFFVSKLPIFNQQPLPRLQALDFRAGLYKPSTVRPEHGLLLSTLSGNKVQTHVQLHGKRQKKTLSINANLQGAPMWNALDKFTHELIPHMQDLMTPKGRLCKITRAFTLRFRQKFTIVDEFEDILDSNLYDTHKGVYLPLTLHLKLVTPVKPALLEMYLRMLRLPVTLHRRKPRPAYDDRVVFVGMEELYRQISYRRAPIKKK